MQTADDLQRAARTAAGISHSDGAQWTRKAITEAGPRRAALPLAAVTAAMVAAAAGCGDSAEGEHAVRTSLCGIHIKAATLAPLLPPGKRVSLTPDTPVPDAITTCEVAVDKKVVLSVERERREPGAAARDIAVDRLSAHDPQSAAARTIAYTDAAAVSITRCTAQDVVKEDISTVIRVFEPGHKDESALKNLITEYTAALRKSSPCEVKSG
ncbi:hypothetical protein [Streptomyces sp. AcE210]|uniref:hypothetical protein n=1 Tax=Streptomyces sp. AcE210 TaxID=2292703 RepID=UPI000E3032B3|nr:hypothetical protein [Streptomyces sp. AcE210]RFC71965.1 hypothetical protein DXZ75_33730 [Streptomyces sp. AcE210]